MLLTGVQGGEAKLLHFFLQANFLLSYQLRTETNMHVYPEATAEPTKDAKNTAVRWVVPADPYPR